MSMPECGDSCAAPQGSFGPRQISLDAIAQLRCPWVPPLTPPPFPPLPFPSFLLKGVTDKTLQLLECYALL